MKKFIIASFPVVVACSFTAAVLAADNPNIHPVKLSQQILQSEETPAPVPDASTAKDSAPEPIPETAPDPTPEPYFSPDP